MRRTAGGATLRTLVLSGVMLALTGCQTSTSVVTASNPHPNLPKNYRRVLADYMKTQFFAQLAGDRLSGQAIEISDPHRNFYGHDVVCVRFGGPNFPIVRAYAFSDGQIVTWTGNIISEYGSGVVVMAVHCGDEPVFRPFPEWNSAR
jgi:hypothetical protein